MLRRLAQVITTDFKDIILSYPRLDDLSAKITERVKAGHVIFPQAENIFRAFDEFDVAKTKVVIIGQDCYHTPDVADGLAFSTFPTNRVPPSLNNVYAEIKRCYPEFDRTSPDLTSWARQGVLLINCALTVESGKPNSHAALWSEFSDHVIGEVTRQSYNAVFMLWGNFAKNKYKTIQIAMEQVKNETDDKDYPHCILTAGHPSPFSVQWFAGCRHFIKANDYLMEHGREPVDWRGQ